MRFYSDSVVTLEDKLGVGASVLVIRRGASRDEDKLAPGESDSELLRSKRNVSTSYRVVSSRFPNPSNESSEHQREI